MTTVPRALVLMYHQIEPDFAPSGWVPNSLADPRYGLLASRFREQIALLRELGIPVAGLGEVLSGPENGKTPFPFSIVVTFDDGYASDWERASPILEEFRIPATFFLTTGLLGNPGMLTPRQARDLSSSPLFTLGSHGVTHRFLSHLSPGECQAEIRESLESLVAIGGPGKYALSAPGGRSNARVEEAARMAGMLALLTSRPGVFQEGENRYAIPRLPVMRSWSIDDFRRHLDPRSLPFHLNRWIRSFKTLVQTGLESPRSFSFKDAPPEGGGS